jgi:Helix-turn-helix of insertion element transposase
MPNQTKTWHADQLRFIEWLATPKQYRKPKTQRLFAQVIQVDEATLSDWKRLDGFLDDVTALARFHLKGSLSDIFAALSKAAIAGDVPAIKLALEVAGEYTPKQDITSAGEKLGAPTIYLPGVEADEDG